MKLYIINATPVQKVFTEQQNVDNINDYPKVVAGVLKARGIDGFTIYQVQGYWKGESEVSFKIELAIEDQVFVRSIMHDIAIELRDMYLQDSVMLTYPNNTVEFI